MEDYSDFQEVRRELVARGELPALDAEQFAALDAARNALQRMIVRLRPHYVSGETAGDPHLLRDSRELLDRLERLTATRCPTTPMVADVVCLSRHLPGYGQDNLVRRLGGHP